LIGSNIYHGLFSIDQNEFRSWLGNAGASGSSSFQSSSSGGYDSGSAGLAFNSGVGAEGNSDAYQASSASYSSQSGFESGAAGGQESSYSASALAIGGNESVQNSSASYQSASSQQTSQYPSAGGLYDDPNPQFIRRQAVGGAVTYQQKILVRFLQPPPVPPPGVSTTMFTSQSI
jgi:hypothetical protein